jgi:hypothetical protein
VLVLQDQVFVFDKDYPKKWFDEYQPRRKNNQEEANNDRMM